MSEPRFYAVQPPGQSCAIVYDNDFGYDATLTITGDFAEWELRLAYAEAVAAALNAAAIPTPDSASAVQPERCCLDYPRCDCNSPPEPDNEWHCSQYPDCECFAGCREKALEAFEERAASTVTQDAAP